MSSTPAPKNQALGYSCAIGAQFLWGLFPIYLDWIKEVESSTIVAHRVTWACAFLFALMAIGRWVTIPFLPGVAEFRQTWGKPKWLGLSFVAAILIAINWIVFVWAANHDHKVDASLGYFICPQVIVLLGVVLLGERLNRWQWMAVLIVFAGVTYMATAKAGAVWISLTIAGSFGLYALTKKKTSLSSLGGLTMETSFLIVPAILFQLVWSTDATWTDSSVKNALLVGTGVLTVAPLAMYAIALKHIPLSTVGFLQFIGPTIQFFIGVAVFGEPFQVTRFTGFLIVWIGVGLFLFGKTRVEGLGQADRFDRNKGVG